MKKIPWWEPEIGTYELPLLKKVLENNFPNEGPFTTKFEKKVARLLDVKHAIAVTSATAAMFVSLKAMGIGYGDEVIVPDISFIATANAVEMTGAKAVLVDVNDSLLIDVNCIQRAITKKTKAIIPVHVSGRAAPLSDILTLARKHKLRVIEDAAEAFCSKHKGRYLGTFGDTGCFSLTPPKTITTGQGGIIVTDNTKLNALMRQFKNQGRIGPAAGGAEVHHTLGANFKFTDLQAAVGLAQLRYLPKRLKSMRRNAYLYRQGLAGLKRIRLLSVDLPGGEIPQWVEALAENREDFLSFLEKRQIGYRKFWYPIHTQKYYKCSNRQFPKSTKLSEQACWLPSSFRATEADIYRVCTAIKEYETKKQKK